MKQTPEQRAEARWPETPPHAHGLTFTHLYQREAHATCIREEVEPLEAEVGRLRALVQEFAIALERCVNENGEVWGGEIALIAAAKSQGFVPTNTTE